MQTWGRYGAAGLLVRDRNRVLLQLRSARVQHGGTWSIPGGARHVGEHVVEAAMREAREECGIRPRDVRLRGGVHVAEPVAGWRYSTVLARLRKRARGHPLVGAASWEVARHEWVDLDDVSRRSLHPGFAASWPALRRMLDSDGESDGAPVVPRPIRVEFVCSGNICRSPVAAALATSLAAATGEHIDVRSSGVAAEVGAEADAGSVREAERHGLDLSAHRARRFRPSEAARLDAVVVLDAGIADGVRRSLDGWRFRGRLLVRPVPNPWRGTPSAYAAAHRALDSVAAEVVTLAGA